MIFHCDNGPTCSGLSSRDIFGAEAPVSCGVRPLTAEELDFFGPEGAVCKLLGRHDFDDASQCTRCGIIRKMIVDDRSPRYHRGPAHTPHDSGDGAFERARSHAAGMMGDALKGRRERS